MHLKDPEEFLKLLQELKIKRRLLSLLILILCIPPFLRAWAQEITPAPSPTPEPFAGLTAPAPGQALQGLGAVSGSIPAQGFKSAELSFNYAGASSPSWFLVAEFDAAPNGTLAQWDTTRLTDGIYDLRLLVTRADGGQMVSTVPGLRLRKRGSGSDLSWPG